MAGVPKQANAPAPTLLEKALLGRKEVAGLYMSQEAKEEADLMAAWCDGTIETSDVQRVLNLKSTGQVCTRVGTVIRNAVKAGYLKLSRMEDKHAD